jgi:hypothetical protein
MMTPYTYSVLKYVHDPAADESLNIGVLIYAPEAPFVEIKLDDRFKRLSGAFADFDGSHYRRTVQHLRMSVDTLRGRMCTGLQEFREIPGQIEEVTRRLCPDAGLSFRFAPSRPGQTPDIDREGDYLFHRFVLSQYERPKDERRTDEEVWTGVYRRPLAALAVSPRLAEREFSTDEFTLKIDHTFKNGTWHALQPLSMDLTRAEHIQRKAAQWLGNMTLLQGAPDLGKLYILLGRPQSSDLEEAYQRAKHILDKIPVDHAIIEEHEADAFARIIAAKIDTHDEEVKAASP